MSHIADPHQHGLSDEVSRREKHLLTVFPRWDLPYPQGWWSDCHPTCMAHAMLFGGFDQEIRDAVLKLDLPSGRHGRGIRESELVFPLHVWLERHLPSPMKEMVFWHLLTYDAHFQVSMRRLGGKQGYIIERSCERSEPFWSPEDRTVLIHLLQLAGVLNYCSLEQWAAERGYRGRANQVVAYPKR